MLHYLLRSAAQQSCWRERRKKLLAQYPEIPLALWACRPTGRLAPVETATVSLGA